MVVLEALAYGVPVVASDVGGIREWLIPDQTGCVVERGDIVGLARAVRSLVDDPQRSRAFGENGRPVAEARFAPERHLNGFIAVAEVARARWRASKSALLKA